MRFVIVLGLLAACRPPGWGKHAPTDPGETVDANVDTPVSIDAPSGCDHAFRLDGHGQASSVWLTGDFVAWAGDPTTGAIVFTLGPDAAWTGHHVFAAGTYQYKLIIDGSTWIADPTNTNTVDDGFGGKNSVLVCAP